MREQQRAGRVGSSNESEKNTRARARIWHFTWLSFSRPSTPSTLTPPSLPPSVINISWHVHVNMATSTLFTAWLIEVPSSALLSEAL